MYITTPRLTLRPFEETDAPDVIAILRDPVVRKTYMVPDLPTEEAAMRLFTRLADLSRDERRVVVAIALAGKVIGFINDTGIEGESIELGYALSSAYHNCGYCTEAFGAVMEALFAAGFEEILAGAFAHNAASLRVMEKCGMEVLDRVEEIEYRGEVHTCVYRRKLRG